MKQINSRYHCVGYQFYNVLFHDLCHNDRNTQAHILKVQHNSSQLITKNMQLPHHLASQHRLLDDGRIIEKLWQVGAQYGI